MSTAGLAPSGLEQRLRAVVRDVRRDEPLAPHVQFRIGGPAELLVIPRSLEELRETVALLFGERIRPTVLGQGSNVLISDRGIRGVVIKIGKGVDRVVIDGTRVTAEAGAGLPGLALRTAQRGLAGLEFAAGIPGTLGGAVVMNAGAHGHSLSEVIDWIDMFSPEGPRRLRRDAAGFGYRTSSLQREPGVVAQVSLVLRPESPDAVLKRLEDWLAHRGATQPVGPPSSGCIFQNPPGDHAGRLIDHAGVKGLSVGGARVSTLHANYIVNEGSASAADVLSLAEQVRRRVYEGTGIRLEMEVKLLGEF